MERGMKRGNYDTRSQHECVAPSVCTVYASSASQDHIGPQISTETVR